MVDFSWVFMVQVLSKDNQRDIVEFCKNEGLVLLADEVGCLRNFQLCMYFITV